MLIIWIGSLLFICGILFMARTAILRGDMSSPQASTRDHANATLEPDRRSLRFLGVSANWPGIVLVVVGALMMLWGAV